MKKTRKTLYLFLSAALLLGAGCRKHREQKKLSGESLPQVTVRTARAAQQQQSVLADFVGTVRAKTHATLEAKLSGRIQELPVRLGQTVKKGDLVARLDVAETKARLEQVHASFEQAEKDWNRISSLFKAQAVTRSEYDRAEAQERLAKAAVAEAEAMMRYAEVAAPFDGVVSRKWVDVGDLAAPGKPLVDIHDPSALQVEADLPESMAGKIELGALLGVRLDGFDGDLQGKVAEVAPSVDPASRTIRIKATLAPAPGLVPGRFVRVLLPAGQSTTVTVPTLAVVQRGQLELVFVITNGQAQLHLVRTGKRMGGQVAILSGLNAGEIIAVEGANRLADGQRVEAQ